MDSSSRPVIICGIAGSLRRASYNRSLLRAAAELAPPLAEVRIFDRLADVPLFSEDLETQGLPEPVLALNEAIRSADALLIATPEYNHGVPGVLKNAIDWASRPSRGSALTGKPTAVFGASPGITGTARAQTQLRQCFLFTQTPTVLQPEILVYRAAEKFDGGGRLADAKTRDYIRRLLTKLIELVAVTEQHPGVFGS